MSTNSLAISVPERLAQGRMPWILGAVGAGTGILLFLAPLAAAAAGALVILFLSAVENERFLLTVTFLTPVGWVLGKAEALFRAFPARSNVDAALLLRCLVILGFLAGRAWRRRLSVRELVRSALAKATFALAAAILLSALSCDPDLRPASLLRACLRITAYLGFFLMIALWCEGSPERIKKVARVLLASACVAAAFAIVQALAGDYTAIWYWLYPSGSDTFAWDSRSTSFLDYPNDLASYLNLILPLALACAAIRGCPASKLAGWTFALGAAALLCTQSRGGAVAFAFILFAGLFFLVDKARTRILISGIAAALAAACYFVWVGLSPERTGGSDLSSGATRFFLWGVAAQLFAGSPLHGVGWGNFQVLYANYLDSSVVGEAQLGVHSTYLGLLAETGIPGLAAFLALIAVAFRQSVGFLRISRDPFDRALGFGVAGAIVALVAQGFVEFQIAVTQFGILLWTLLALLSASIRIQNARAGFDPELPSSAPAK